MMQIYKYIDGQRFYNIFDHTIRLPNRNSLENVDVSMGTSLSDHKERDSF